MVSWLFPEPEGDEAQSEHNEGQKDGAEADFSVLWCTQWASRFSLMRTTKGSSTVPQTSRTKMTRTMIDAPLGLPR